MTLIRTLAASSFSSGWPLMRPSLRTVRQGVIPWKEKEGRRKRGREGERREDRRKGVGREEQRRKGGTKTNLYDITNG